MANWTGPVQLGCCAPCPPGFIWNSPLPEISLELLVHKNEMKYPRRARIFALFLNIRQFLKESPWGLAWCRCNILMNYIWKALIPEVLLVWFGPSPNPLSSSVAPKLLVVPCPLLSKVSWGCWATGRIKKKNVLLVCFCGCSALGTWSGSTAWWLELKPELSRKTYKQKHHSYTWFCSPLGVWLCAPGLQSQKPWFLSIPSSGRKDEEVKAYGRKDDVRMCPGANPSCNYILSNAFQNILFVRFW